MNVEKQKLIDTYGHYFVLCEHYNHNDPNDPNSEPYVSRATGSHFHFTADHIINDGRLPRTPDKLIIFEFLGHPRLKSDNQANYSYGPTGPYEGNGLPGGELWRRTLFRTLEEAEARAAQIQEDKESAYERIRPHIKEGSKLSASMIEESSELPVDLCLVPDVVSFPDPNVFKRGASFFSVCSSAETGQMHLAETELFSMDLYPIEAMQSGIHRYQIRCGCFIDPNGQGKEEERMAEARFTLSEDGENWVYEKDLSGIIGRPSTQLFLTPSVEEAKNWTRERRADARPRLIEPLR